MCFYIVSYVINSDYDVTLTKPFGDAVLYELLLFRRFCYAFCLRP